MCLVYFIGAFLIMAAAAGIIGDIAGTITGVVLAILWALSIFKAERKSKSQIAGLAFFAFCVFAVISSDFEEWTKSKEQEAAKAEFYDFGREHCPALMETRDALVAKQIELAERKDKLALLAEGETRREAVQAALERIDQNQAKIADALVKIDARLTDMYMLHLDGGDPFTGEPGSAIDGAVSQAQLVLESIDDLSGKNGPAEDDLDAILPDAPADKGAEEPAAETAP